VHLSSVRIHKTINLTMTWPKIKSDVERWSKIGKTCQLAKKKVKKYGKLPAKNAEVSPWNNVQIDCIGPFTVKQKRNGKLIKLKMHTLTIINLVTS